MDWDTVERGSGRNIKLSTTTLNDNGHDVGLMPKMVSSLAVYGVLVPHSLANDATTSDKIVYPLLIYRVNAIVKVKYSFPFDQALPGYLSRT